MIDGVLANKAYDALETARDMLERILDDVRDYEEEDFYGYLEEALAYTETAHTSLQEAEQDASIR